MNLSRTKNQAVGFTLAEMMVVVIIIGIAASVIIPMIGDSSDLQLETAARQLASTLLFAQTYAIANQKKYQVVFDTANHSYEIQDENSQVIKDPTGTSNAENYFFKVTFPECKHLRKVGIDNVNFDGTNKVWFDRMGMPYRGEIADATALASGSVTLKAADRNMVITVEPVTGRIKIN